MQRLPVMHAHMHDSNWTRRVCAPLTTRVVDALFGFAPQVHVPVHIYACACACCMLHKCQWARYMMNAGALHMHRYGLLHKCMAVHMHVHVHVHVACACLARYMMNAGALHMHAYGLLHKCMAVHMHMHVAGCMSMRTCMHDRTRRVRAHSPPASLTPRASRMTL